MNYELVVTNEALKAVCERASAFEQVALDTEFVRTRTYYPQLGLIQLYDGENISLIDPLTITDWQPFKTLLHAENVLKFLHAGSEDLEVFLNTFGILPEPLIDSQVLAAFTGRPLSSGFAALVNDYLHVELDKSESRTDWIARPLSEKQCDYAAADVLYLLPLAKMLLKECEEGGWLAAAKNECDMLCRRRRITHKPELAYKEITNAWQLRPRQLSCLQLLAQWRLNKARERDLAVNFVVREENLWQVARYMPGSLGELDKLGLSGPEIRYHGKTLLALVAEAQEIPDDALLPTINRLVDYPGYKKAFKEVKALIQEASETSGLNSELLASRRQINQLLQWHWEPEQIVAIPELLSGWREELFGEKLKTALNDA